MNVRVAVRGLDDLLCRRTGQKRPHIVKGRAGTRDGQPTQGRHQHVTEATIDAIERTDFALVYGGPDNLGPAQYW